jgi:hypothetical protein
MYKTRGLEYPFYVTTTLLKRIYVIYIFFANKKIYKKQALEWGKNMPKKVKINEQMWAEELVRMAKKELQNMVRLQQEMIFKLKKISGQFIYTLCDGDLLYRIGLIPDQVVGKALHDFLHTEKMKCYQRVWEGEELVTYESMSNGITYFAALRPIKRGGEVIEVIGSCVDIFIFTKENISINTLIT